MLFLLGCGADSGIRPHLLNCSVCSKPVRVWLGKVGKVLSVVSELCKLLGGNPSVEALNCSWEDSNCFSGKTASTPELEPWLLHQSHLSRAILRPQINHGVRAQPWGALCSAVTNQPIAVLWMTWETR